MKPLPVAYRGIVTPDGPVVEIQQVEGGPWFPLNKGELHGWGSFGKKQVVGRKALARDLLLSRGASWEELGRALVVELITHLPVVGWTIRGAALECFIRCCESGSSPDTLRQQILEASEIPRLAPPADWKGPEKYADPSPGDLRVWWIPQIPGKPFHVPVETAEEAARVVEMLASYDAFQFENRIKPDYANVGGLQVFEEDADGDGNPGWSDWSTTPEGVDFDEYRKSLVNMPDFWAWKGGTA